MTFIHIALCIESYENAVSLGRLDQILYPYYKRDLEAGILTYEKAKELLALFILKMDEAILVNDGDTYLRIGRLFETMSTDQSVTAGGLGRDGKDATNDLTYMLLDICELQPYAVNMTARIHENSPVEYLDRLAEVYINGAPMPALYNDEIYLETIQKHYPVTRGEREELRDRRVRRAERLGRPLRQHRLRQRERHAAPPAGDQGRGGRPVEHRVPRADGQDGWPSSWNTTSGTTTGSRRSCGRSTRTGASGRS